MLSALQKTFPHLNFKDGGNFVWSPGLKTVFYDPKRLNSNTGKLSLLHELGHAILEHTDYNYDIELIEMEVEAWEKARAFARKYKVKIDEEHIDFCIESYRFWIYKRSLCPECQYTGVQQELTHYYCFACQQDWRISPACSVRPYRIICDMDQLKTVSK
ncbi:MAG: hypothetical protein WDZ81_00645 [Candidatus Saccharimonadales bacterium]